MTCTNQCTTATECAAGYTCTGGTCTPRGDTGDPCTVSLVCKACNVCTRENASSALSFCRACCAGMGAGGFCNSCPNTACGSDQHLPAALSTGQLQRVPARAPRRPPPARPATTASAPTACSATWAAAAATCNPASPGACAACYSHRRTAASARAADEISMAGEPCGQIGTNTLAACGAGLACVGNTSGVCRARCETDRAELLPHRRVVPVGERRGRVHARQRRQHLRGLHQHRPVPRRTRPATSAAATTRATSTCANACSTCVQSMAGGGGICGCSDQISPENGPCGTQPDVHACQNGTKCLNSVCRARVRAGPAQQLPRLHRVPGPRRRELLLRGPGDERRRWRLDGRRHRRRSHRRWWWRRGGWRVRRRGRLDGSRLRLWRVRQPARRAAVRNRGAAAPPAELRTRESSPPLPDPLPRGGRGRQESERVVGLLHFARRLARLDPIGGAGRLAALGGRQVLRHLR